MGQDRQPFGGFEEGAFSLSRPYQGHTAGSPKYREIFRGEGARRIILSSATLQQNKKSTFDYRKSGAGLRSEGKSF